MIVFFVYSTAIFELPSSQKPLAYPSAQSYNADTLNIENASRLFCREAFLTTWITTDARGTGGNGGSKEGTRVTEYERK